jgi:hypothetical protein
MKRLFLALLCFCMLFSFASAAEYTQERVINLPQDQGMWYMSLYGDPANPQFKQLQEWLRTNQGLASLRSQVHYNEYTTRSPRFNRYAATLPSLPCLRIQNSKGKVVSEFWGDYIPRSSSALYRGVCEDIQGKTSFRFVIHHRRYHCPGPSPEPAPTPPEVPVPIVDTPPVIEEPEPEKPGIPWLLVGLAVLIGGGIGIGSGYKREHIDQPTAPTKL